MKYGRQDFFYSIWLPNFPAEQNPVSRPFCCKTLLCGCNSCFCCGQKGQWRVGEGGGGIGERTLCVTWRSSADNWFFFKMNQNRSSLSFYVEWALLLLKVTPSDSTVSEKTGKRASDCPNKRFLRCNLRVVKTEQMTSEHHLHSIIVSVRYVALCNLLGFLG